MSFETIHHGALEYLRAASLGAANAFSTRLGGVSAGPLASLNLAVRYGDNPANVRENWRRFGEAAGFSLENLVCAKQVHGNFVRIVTRDNRGEGPDRPAVECDGLATDVPGVALAVFSADCTPILLCDEKRGAVAAVHAGWRGTALGIAQKAVEAMTAAFGTDPKDVRAAIGPCIDRCCFETRADVPEAMRAALGAAAEIAIDEHGGGRFHVDLKDLNAIFLERAGVRHIETCPFCTACQPERFWSHRRDGDARGSMAAVIVCPGGGAQ